MKTSSLSFATLTTLAFSAVSVGFAQTPAFSTQPPTSSVQTAGAHMTLTALSPADEPFALSRLSGRALHSANQEELGSVADFLVDPTSGKVRFAIVPTGRGASGETFRLVPTSIIDATNAANGSNPLIARITRAQWEQVGTMVEQEVGARVSLNSEQLQRNSKQFGITGQDDSAGANNLVRASSLKGQSLLSGNEQIAVIDDVLIDVSRQAAAAVVVPAGVSAAANQKFVVPFQQMQVAATGQGAITTTLTRADFQQTNGALTPTGYSSADTAVTTVQQAIANNRNLAGTGVQVASEPRLVLRGNVPSEQQRTEAERTAAQAAPGVQIDNQITVRRW
jgi:hypothetical protein